MIGQRSLFETDADLPLRQRITIQLAPVSDVRDTLVRFHYLHRVRVGRQLNYHILIDGIIDGVITYAYPMICAPLEGVPSDELIEFARLFLSQNIPHSASCAIGKSLKRVQYDWLHAFPTAKPPRLVVSWSDTEYHKGTIYKAANFVWLRRTAAKARGKNRYANHDGNFSGARTMREDHWHDKDCWLYWLKPPQFPPSQGAFQVETSPAQPSTPS